MKFNKLFSKITLATVAVTVAATFAVAAVRPAFAIPYEGEDTPGLSHPAFNVYTGTPSVGDESDFFKGKVETDTGYVNNVSSACASGTRFALRIYVHNAANQNLNNNGTGPGVAHNTKVRVALPGDTNSQFDLNSVITSSNASSVSDGMTINCNGKQVKLAYVPGTAKQFTVPGGTKALSDSIVTTGAPIGTNAPNGDVWGCWDQRVWVTLVVDVKDAPKASTGECKVANLETFENRRVKVNVEGTVNNAQIIGYEIDFGDGTKSNQQSAEHTYAADGTYRIVTKVQIKFADGRTEWKTADACTKEVTFSPGQPPEVPQELPDTGAGEMFGIFTGVTAAGAFLHRRFMGKRA